MAAGVRPHPRRVVSCWGAIRGCSITIRRSRSGWRRPSPAHPDNAAMLEREGAFWFASEDSLYAVRTVPDLYSRREAARDGGHHE